MRYLTLDGLRGVAAIAVMLFHYCAAYGFNPFPRGYLAVDLFFLISGFVIAGAYESRLRRDWTVGHFIRVRAVRLYPMVLVSVGSVLALRAIYPVPQWPSAELLRQAALNAALVPDFCEEGTDLFPLVGPSWSLFYELIVNIAYAAALPLLSRRILVVIIGLTGSLLAFAAFQEGTVELIHQNIPSGLCRTVFSFGLGVLAYRNKPRVIAFFRRVPAPAAYMLALATFAMPAMPIGAWAFDLFAIAIVSPLAFIIATREPRKAAGTIESRLGDLSYPLYLLHIPVALYVGVGLGWVVSGPPLTIIAAIVAMVASALAFHADDLLQRALKPNSRTADQTRQESAIAAWRDA